MPHPYPYPSAYRIPFSYPSPSSVSAINFSTFRWYSTLRVAFRFLSGCCRNTNVSHLGIVHQDRSINNTMCLNHTLRVFKYTEMPFSALLKTFNLELYLHGEFRVPHTYIHMYISCKDNWRICMYLLPNAYLNWFIPVGKRSSSITASRSLRHSSYFCCVCQFIRDDPLITL